MKKRGISLIVLIVTIIVIIILAAVVILTLSKNNPINSAKEATFKEDIYNYKTELELYKAKISKNGEDVTKLYASKDSDPSIQDVITSITRKYIDRLEVREGKLAYVGKDKTEYILAKDMGLLPEDELLDDDILTELKPFITEWTVEAGDSITLPIGGTCNFTVDYGDGTGEYKVTSSTDEDRIHTYENAGTYAVTITGKCETFDATNIADKDKLTKLIQWGAIEATRYSFTNCSQLIGTIPEPSKNSFIKLNNVYGLFSNTKIGGDIPEKLFYNCPNLIKYEYIFCNCKGISKIPEKLFIKCKNAESFNAAFYGSGITTIPKDLFKNCINIKTLNSTFYSCKELKGSIHEDLFKNCPNLQSVNSTFLWCSNLNGNIPEKLFSNNLKITDFWGTFSNCIQLQGKAPNIWVRDNVTNSAYCFNNCTNLSNYNDIPAGWK